MKWFLLVLLFYLPAAAINVGESAPDFSLKQYNGGAVTLSEFRGKVVHLFFLGYS